MSFQCLFRVSVRTALSAQFLTYKIQEVVEVPCTVSERRNWSPLQLSCTHRTKFHAPLPLTPESPHVLQGKHQVPQPGLLLFTTLAGSCQLRATCPTVGLQHHRIHPATTTLVAEAGRYDFESPAESGALGDWDGQTP